MSDLKTKPNDQSVEAFLQAIDDEAKRADSIRIVELMREVTGQPPKMWGGSIIGFGSYHYKYDSGREGDWFVTGFSPRKTSLTLYIMSGFSRYDDLLSQLGKYKTGKSCLYIKKLGDVDMNILKQLVQETVNHMRKNYPTF